MDVVVDMFVAVGWITDVTSASLSAGVLSTSKVSNCLVSDVAAMDGAGWTLASVEHVIMGQGKDSNDCCSVEFTAHAVTVVSNMAAMDDTDFATVSVMVGILDPVERVLFCGGACVIVAFGTSLPLTKDSLCILRAVDNV